MNQNDNELAHYGVVGMRWGVLRANTKRKQNAKSGTKISKLEYKAQKAAEKAKRLETKHQMGDKAYKTSLKAERLKTKAAKKKYKYQKNEAYIAKMDKKLSEISTKNDNAKSVIDKAANKKIN